MATSSPRAAPSPKPARESAALRRTMGSGSWISRSKASWNGGSGRSPAGTSAPHFDSEKSARPIAPAHAVYVAAWSRPKSRRRGRNRRAFAQTTCCTKTGRGTAPTRARTARSINTRAGRDAGVLGEFPLACETHHTAGALIAIEEGVEGHDGLRIFRAEFAYFGDSAHGAAPGLAGARVDDPDVADAEAASDSSMVSSGRPPAYCSRVSSS